MKVFNQQRGYTLIGVLLIILVVSAVSLYFAIELQQKARLRKIYDTAVKMQAILEAGLRYHLNVDPKLGMSHWPFKLADLVPDYLPESALCSGWPKNTNPSACLNNANLAAFTLNDPTAADPTFFITITLPDENLASMLKNTLSGSIQNGAAVTAMISIPSEWNRIQQMGLTFPEPFYNHNLGKDSQGGIITPIPYPKCPPDLDPQLFILPFAWNKPWKIFDTMVSSFGELNMACDIFNNCDYKYGRNTRNTSSNEWKVYHTVKGTGGKIQTNNVFTYFTYCADKNGVYSGDRIGYR